MNTLRNTITNLGKTLKAEKLSFLYILFGALLASGIATVSAQWTGNNATPPANNVDAPLNVSVSKQEKKGPIWANTLSNAPIGLVVFGQAQIRGGTPGEGKVLVSVDDQGTAEWRAGSNELEYKTCSDTVSSSHAERAIASCTVSCSVGKQVTGGGCKMSGPTVGVSYLPSLFGNNPTSGNDGWECAATYADADRYPSQLRIDGYAICQ